MKYMRHPAFKLSIEEVKPAMENVLELFYSGIKSAETRRTMEGNLKRFLVDACADILQGDLVERAKEFVNMAKDDQDRAVGIVMAYVRRLRERAAFDRADPRYLNPASIPNKIKPIRKLLEMNNLGLGWKRIYTLYPERDNTHKGRGYTRAELQRMLEYSDSIETGFIILASSSGGFRVGAWTDQVWGNVFPVYEVDGTYKIELEENDVKNARVVCSGMIIYKGTPQEYVALISIESWNKLQEHKRFWTARMKRPPTSSDPLLVERFHHMVPMTQVAIEGRIHRLLIKSGIRTPLTEGRRRHEVPGTHGFRRYWDKVMMETARTSDTLSALVKKERLMGHTGIVSTDKNYYWTNILDMVPDYLKTMPYLMVNEELKLKMRLESEKQENQKLAKACLEKEEALQRLAEVEAKIKRMEKYHITPG
jgi:hypothetical protein